MAIWDELTVTSAPDTVVISMTEACNEAGEVIPFNVHLVLSQSWAVELANKILAAAAGAGELLVDAVKHMPPDDQQVPHA